MTVGVRPESLALASAGEGLPATVSIVEELGAEALVHAALEIGSDRAPERSQIVLRVESGASPRNGAPIHLRIKDGSMLFFDAVTGVRIAARTE